MTELIELIRVAVGRQKKLRRRLTDAEWRELYVEAKKQALLGVCFAGVEVLPKEQLPNTRLLMYWYGQVENLKKQYKLQCEALPKIVALLETEGLEYRLLKGLALANLYRSTGNQNLCPQLRTLGDFDIWVKSDKTRILQFAEKYGKVGDVVYHHVDVGPIENVEVELHFHPSNLKNVFANNRMQKWFDNNFYDSEELNVGDGKTIHTNSLAFNRIYVLNHIYRHLLYKGVGLRQFLDYYFVLMASREDADLLWETKKIETRRLIKEFEMEKFSNAITWVLLYFFEPNVLTSKKIPNWVIGTPDEKRGRQLLDEMLKGGNFGIYSQDKKYKLSDPWLKRYTNRIRYDIKFLWLYPEEVLWRPIWFVWKRWGKWIEKRDCCQW